MKINRKQLQSVIGGEVRKPRLLIVGHGRHGKDELASIFKKNYSLRFSSSSEAAAKIFIYDALKDERGYESFKQCYNDRHNHRALWYDMICEFNKDDKARLAKLIMAENEIYVGMRDESEIQACLAADLFDCVIWVNRPSTPLEGSDSFNIDKSHADLIFHNDGTLDDLALKVDYFMNFWVAGKICKEKIEFVY